MKNRSGKAKVIVSSVVGFCLIGAMTMAFVYKQTIVDHIIAWQYQPSSEMSEIANQSGLNDYGKFMLYASQPSLESANDFNTSCDSYETTTAVLGCYSNEKIYIYNINNDQLDGIKEVTAVHEMLHASYERLSSGEKEKVDKLLEAEYQKLSADSSLKEKMSYYDNYEPGQKYNELHSILATEVSDIGSDLESYYAKYFSNRQIIVTLYQNYSSVFDELEAQASDIASQLNTLSSDITAKTESYNSEVVKLNSDIKTFNAKAAAGEFSSTAEFYSEREDLITRIDNLDTTRESINNEISQYNTLLDQYNSITTQTTNLYNSINSTLVDAPSL